MSVPTSNGTGRQLASASSIHGTFPWEQRLLQKLTGKARGQWAGNRDDDWVIGATDNTGRAVVKELRALGHAILATTVKLGGPAHCRPRN